MLAEPAVFVGIEYVEEEPSEIFKRLVEKPLSRAAKLLQVPLESDT